MAKQTENTETPNEKEITKELLEKSAALKEKTAILKAQMEETAKVCQQLLNPDGSTQSSGSSG